MTDVGLHQVFKFSHDGRLLLSLGQRRASAAGTRRISISRPTSRSAGRHVLRVGRLRQQPRRAVRGERALPQRVGQERVRGEGSSATRTASRSAPMATCSSPIGRTRAFRCSIARARSSGNGSAPRRPAACFQSRSIPPARCMSASGGRTTIRRRTACSKLDREWNGDRLGRVRRRGRSGVQRRARPRHRSRRRRSTSPKRAPSASSSCVRVAQRSALSGPEGRGRPTSCYESPDDDVHDVEAIEQPSRRRRPCRTRSNSETDRSR